LLGLFASTDAPACVLPQRLAARPNRCIAELAQPGSEGGLDHLGICRCELVFEREGRVRPGGKSLRINELLELADKLVSKVLRSVWPAQIRG